MHSQTFTHAHYPCLSSDSSPQPMFPSSPYLLSSGHLHCAFSLSLAKLPVSFSSAHTSTFIPHHSARSTAWSSFQSVKYNHVVHSNPELHQLQPRSSCSPIQAQYSASFDFSQGLGGDEYGPLDSKSYQNDDHDHLDDDENDYEDYISSAATATIAKVASQKVMKRILEAEGGIKGTIRSPATTTSPHDPKPDHPADDDGIRAGVDGLLADYNTVSSQTVANKAPPQVRSISVSSQKGTITPVTPPSQQHPLAMPSTNKFLDDANKYDPVIAQQQLNARKIRHLGLKGKWTFAMDLFRETKYKNMTLWNGIIATCGRAGQWVMCLKLLNEMKADGFTPNYATYHRCLVSCLRHGTWEKSLEILAEQYQMGKINEKTYAIIIEHWETQKDLKKALMVLEIMKRHGRKPTVLEYKCCMQVAVVCKNWQVCFQLYDQILQAKLKPTSTCYYLAILSAEMSGEYERGMALFDALIAARLFPSRDCYGSYINICIKLKEWKTALTVMRQMQQARIKPDLNQYDICKREYDIQRKKREHFTHLKRLRSQGIEPGLQDYEACLQAAADNKDTAECIALLKDMTKNNIQPDLTCYTIILESCADTADWKSALAVLSQMKKQQQLQQQELINLRQQQGQQQNENQPPEPENKQFLTSKTYNLIMHALQKGEKYSRILKVMVDMRKQNVDPDVQSYNFAMVAFRKTDQPRKAIDLIKVMEAKGLTPNVVSYNHAISAAGDGRQWKLCVQLFERMKARKVTPSYLTYKTAIHACQRGGNWDYAFYLMDRQKKKWERV